MRKITITLLVVITISILNCSPNIQDGVFIIVSKVDCINCRKPVPSLVDIAQKAKQSIFLINSNCRELEMNGIAKDFSVVPESVTCFEKMGSTISRNYEDKTETYVIVVQNNEIVFESPVRNVDIEAYSRAVNK